MIDAYLVSAEFAGRATVKGLAASSQRSYRLYLTHSREAFGKLKPDAVKPMHIMALRDQFAGTPIAANMIIRALGAVYKWARPRGKAAVNPCDKLPMFESGEHEPWPVELVRLVVENGRPEIRRFALLTVHTGQREGDVCAMSLGDVEGNDIRVIQEKTGKPLWIPMHGDLAPVVAEVRASSTPYFISRPNGQPMTANQFRAMWGREKRKAWAKPIRDAGLVPHGMCKNAHNRFFEAGNNAKEVESLTGRSPTMVAHYSKGGSTSGNLRVVRWPEPRRWMPVKVLQTPGIPKRFQAASSKAM
jgi:integrase